MNELELWQMFIAGVAVPVAVYWLKDGIVNLVKARRARREELAQDEAKAQAQEGADLRSRAESAERRVRVLDDYAHKLRAHIDARNPPPPPEWPPLITTDD